jgi:hypothetical protein
MRFVVLLILAGCGAAHAPPAPIIRVENRAPWPYRLEQVAVWIDDELYFRRVEEAGRPLEIASLGELPPGDHLVYARIHVRMPCRPDAPATDALWWTIRSARRVHVEGRAELDLTLYGDALDRNVDLRWALHALPGSRAHWSDGDLHRPPEDSPRCELPIEPRCDYEPLPPTPRDTWIVVPTPFY